VKVNRERSTSVTVSFTHEEIQEKLGLDLTHFFYVDLDDYGYKRKLVFSANELGRAAFAKPKSTHTDLALVERPVEVRRTVWDKLFRR
jgi:hypothetical protein